MAILTITLLLANVALVAAALVKFKNLEEKVSHDLDKINTKVENVRMRHKQDIKELEECMVTKLEDVKSEVLTQEEVLEHHVTKSTESLFWRIVTTPLKMNIEEYKED